MFSLFNASELRETRLYIQPSFTRVRSLLGNNLNRVIDYHRISNHSTASNHLLVRILQTLPITNHHDTTSLLPMVEDLTGDISRAFSLPSAYRRGDSINPGPFLGETGPELIILTEERFDIAHAVREWENVSPVRFIHHPHSDLSMTVPVGLGGFSNHPKGYSAVEINLPLLALQYSLWRKRELKRNPEYPQTTMHFVAQYVLSNALVSYVDVCFMNLFWKIANEESVNDLNDNHPFYFNPYFEETVDGLRQLAGDVKNMRMSFDSLLNTLSSVSGSSFQSLLRLPNVPQTRKVIPALLAARLPIIVEFVRWDAISSTVGNRDLENKVDRTLKQVRSMNISRYSDIEDHIHPLLTRVRNRH